MKKILSMNALMFYLIGCTSSPANNSLNTNHVVVNRGRYSDYYHIEYTLTGTNFVLQKNGDGFSDEDGQFEIYINRQEFPIPSPNCKDKLILRMPSTVSDDEKHNESINRKKRLYGEIKKVYDSESSSLDVVIELNPYVKVKSKNPLILELETCNIFFRTKNNQYIDTLD